MRRWRRNTEEHGVPEDDRDPFAERALSLLVSLHEGNAGRSRITPVQLAAWLAKFRA